MATSATNPQAMMISPAGVAVIRRFEGFRAEAARLADGRYVVGYGHVRSSPPTAPFNTAEAERALGEDLAPVAALLNETILAPVSQNQFDALASFAFSIGSAAFKSSDVLRKLNAGEPIAAACAMDAWRKSQALGEQQVIDILVRRRAAEKALFLDSEALPAGPSAFLRPGIDHAQAILSSAAIAPAPSLDAVVAAPADDVAEKLIGILSSEPASAAALAPQPAATIDAPEDVLELTEVAPAASVDQSGADGKEMRAFLLLALAGLTLIGIGASALFGGADGATTVFFLLAAPGVAVTAMAGYYLAKANWRGSKADRTQLPGAAFAG
jgi:lysozyme